MIELSYLLLNAPNMYIMYINNFVRLPEMLGFLLSLTLCVNTVVNEILRLEVLH